MQAHIHIYIYIHMCVCICIWSPPQKIYLLVGSELNVQVACLSSPLPRPFLASFPSLSLCLLLKTALSTSSSFSERLAGESRRTFPQQYLEACEEN